MTQPIDFFPVRCRLCGHSVNRCGVQRILRSDVAIEHCRHCDLLQTEAPHWLGEAYSEAISSLDTGALQRNQVTVGVTLAVARILGLGADAPCLDWGGGHGVFVRMMRDRGFNFRWHDQYAENLFARGFEGPLDTTYDLITSFEVFEHFVDVKEQLERLFAQEPTHVLVSTLLHNGYQDNWWYFANDTGQHVAFYSAKTMRHIAEHFGYEVVCGPAHSVFFRKHSLSGTRRAMLQLVVKQANVAFAMTSLVPEAVRLVSKRSRTQRDYKVLAGARADAHDMSPSGTDADNDAAKPHRAT